MVSHYLLDVMGTTRGIALFYPLPREYDLPVGISVASRYAPVVTLLITTGELALVAGLVTLTAPIDGPAFPMWF